MAVRRDPDTGKFVSVDSDEGRRFMDYRSLRGSHNMRIPAADLTGNPSDQEEVHDQQVFDIGEAVDDDEVFECVWMAYSWSASITLSSSGFNVATIRGGVIKDGAGIGGWDNSPWGNADLATGGEQGIADLKTESVRIDELLDVFLATVSNGEADDVNGVGRGAEFVSEHQEVYLEGIYGQGPVLDSSDFIGLDYQVMADGASNVGFNFEWEGVLTGRVHQL